MPDVRAPAVAGRFYEAVPDRLEASLRECFLHRLGPGSLSELAGEGPRRIAAVVSPHAGYVYSGPAAACSFAALAADGIPDTAVVLGPSHYAADRRAAVSLVEAWQTPLGEVAVNVELGRRLMADCPLIVEDEQAHRFEHSLEVQVPFLQFVYGDRTPSICPICIRSHPMWRLDQLVADAKQIGEALARALPGPGGVVIASTDFSHQLPQQAAEHADRLALEAILAMAPDRLLETVLENDISMCGPVPVAVALYWALAKGKHRAELLRYYTSGDIIGDRGAVVGYGSAVVAAV